MITRERLYKSLKANIASRSFYFTTAWKREEMQTLNDLHTLLYCRVIGEVGVFSKNL